MNILQKLNPTYLTQNALQTLKRFPFVMVFAVLTGILCELKFKSSLSISMEAILVSSIGIAAFLSLHLFLERSQNKFLAWPQYILFLALLGLTYWLNPEGINSSAFRLVQILIAVHLLVAIAPFLVTHEKNSFWFFNQALFLRFVLSTIYTTVLVSGIMIILATIHYLFGIEIGESVYRYVYLFCYFGFHPLHFLNGVPEDFEELKQKEIIPKGLIVFCKYLLVPLVCVYGIILLTYCSTILFAREWPKGIISGMIIGYSIVGIFTQLMIYPLVNPEHGWAQRFVRLFNLTLLILSFVILAAVGRRLGEYGMTESRYFLVLTGLWLMGMSIYLMRGHKKDIRLIPLTLFVITFMTAFGPWGAYSVSLRMQMNRLEKILERNKVLVKGVITKVHPEVSWTEADDVTEIIDYIVKRHGPKPLIKLYPTSTFPHTTAVNLQSFMDAMAVKATGKKNGNQTYFHVNNNGDIPVAGFKSLRMVKTYGSGKIEDSPWEIVSNEKRFIIKFKSKIVFDESNDTIIQKLGITPENYSSIKLKPLIISYESMKAEIHFEEMSGNFAEVDKLGVIQNWGGVILY